MVNDFPEKVETLLEKLYRKHRDEFLELCAVKNSFKRRYKSSTEVNQVQVSSRRQKRKESKNFNTRTSLGLQNTVNSVLREKHKMTDVSM